MSISDKLDLKSGDGAGGDHVYFSNHFIVCFLSHIGQEENSVIPHMK